MKKYFVISLLFVLICFSGAEQILAADYDLDVDVQCPSSVQPGKTLTVTVKIENYSCSGVKLTRYMSGLVVNKQGNLGNVGIYGPYPNYMKNKYKLQGICIQNPPSKS